MVTLGFCAVNSSFMSFRIFSTEVEPVITTVPERSEAAVSAAAASAVLSCCVFSVAAGAVVAGALSLLLLPQAVMPAVIAAIMPITIAFFMMDWISDWLKSLLLMEFALATQNLPFFGM